ncbi:MAG: M61 family metallopeptidase [Planctomycetota bacterium]|jgi:predicted metalloprotease with PDZ domain
MIRQMPIAAAILTAMLLLPFAACAAAVQVEPPGDAAEVLGPPPNRLEPLQVGLDLMEPQTQMLGVGIRVPWTGRDELEFMLPSWRPGRYEILDPVGTLRELTATDDGGRTLPVRKTAKNRWVVSDIRGQPFTVRYRVYANSIGDRTRHVDDTHAFISPSSCILALLEDRERPIMVTANAPAGWRMSTGLPQRPGPRGLPSVAVVAENYDQLVDSPLEIGRQAVLDFEVDGIPHEIVIWPPDADRDDAVLVEDFTAIVEECRAIFGRLPYRRYVFMIHVGAGGGGTEHVNSTIMQTSEAALRGSRGRDAAWRGLLRLTAHEFFHTWNVKQFRPAGLKPYDYDRENHTDLLWVAEGSTTYYDKLIPARAGLMTAEQLLDSLGGQIRSTRDRPARRVQSVAAASFDAWTVFNRPTPDHVNCSISFYTKGSMVSFLLDLEVRRLTEGRASLDTVMSRLFDRFPLNARGYTTADLKAILTEVTGADLSPFFERYVDGVEPLPLEEAVRALGLELVQDPRTPEDGEASVDEDEDGFPDRPWIGLDLRDSDGRTVVRSVRSDGPAYLAGLQAGDEIVAMDGRRISAGELDAFLRRQVRDAREARRAAVAAGEPFPDRRLRVTYFRRDRLREVVFSVATRPDAAWTLRRRDDATDAEKQAYADWCGHPWPSDSAGEEPAADAGA